MNNLTYLLQVSACTAIFYLFYYFFLNRLTFFTTNRWYLLVTLVLSFTIPLIKIQISQPHIYTGVVQQVVEAYAPQVNTTTQLAPVTAQVEVKSAPITWDVIVKLIYTAAVLGLSVHLLINLLTFFKQIRGKRIAKLGNINVLSGDKKIANGSFLNYIFLNDDELSTDEIKQIIAHEMLHVRLYHSVDRIIFKVAQIVLWFNPFIYLYARSVEENHEFEVDRAMALDNNKHNYANLLVHLSVARNGTLYHNFSAVPLKKRIKMLFNQPSNNMRKIIYVLILPVVIISCLAFAKIKSDIPVSQYSVLEEAEHLPDNTSVVIDGKIYPKDIIYKISATCIKGTSYFPANKYLDPKTGKIALFNKDRQTVIIRTKKGVITYMDDRERSNLIAEHNVPHTLYNRIALKNEDGTLYDMVIVESPGKWNMTSKMSHGGKAGFIFSDKVLDEVAFKNLPVDVKLKIINTTNVSVLGNKGADAISRTGYELNLDKYETVFTFDLASQKQDAEIAPVAPKKSVDVKQDTTQKSDYEKSAEGQRNVQLQNLILNKTITVKVKAIDKVIDPKAESENKPTSGIVFDYKGNEYSILCWDKKEKELKKLLEVGDVITLKITASGSGNGMPVFVSPAYVIKENVKIFEANSSTKLNDIGKSTSPVAEGNNASDQQQVSSHVIMAGDYLKSQPADFEEMRRQNILSQQIVNKTVTVVVKAIDVPINPKNKPVTANTPLSGIVFDYKGSDYSILCWNEKEKELKKKLNPGDMITFKVSAVGFGNGMPVFVSPEFVIKDNTKIYELQKFAMDAKTEEMYKKSGVIKVADGENEIYNAIRQYEQMAKN